jgi:hypothetical protein
MVMAMDGRHHLRACRLRPGAWSPPGSLGPTVKHREGLLSAAGAGGGVAEVRRKLIAGRNGAAVEPGKAG